jgi:hypothetical protein
MRLRILIGLCLSLTTLTLPAKAGEFSQSRDLPPPEIGGGCSRYYFAQDSGACCRGQRSALAAPIGGAPERTTHWVC